MESQQPTRKEIRQQKKRRRTRRRFLLLGAAALLLAAILLSQAMPNPSILPQEPQRNPYRPEDFTTSEGYVTCTAVPTLRGLDVSEHQGRIDWPQVQAAGFDFAFIRIGYRGYTVGEIFPDDRALENLAGARAAGLQVGAYFYAQAISPEEAAQEARWCLDFLGNTSLDLPLVYDWEYVSPSARTGGMDKATLTQCALTFCDTVTQAGFEAMVYFNNHISRDLLDLTAIERYPFWLAQYTEQLDYPWKVDFWQYTDSGSVPGIEGNVDIDLMFCHE